ncbi:MAG: MMPL family transporter [Deltaproteobacteria bacterium]|nr:MMPL family transporter [Deltaproteobacteria bacterium]
MTSPSPAHRFFSELAAQLIQRRWLVLALVAALTAFMAAQTPRLELNTNNDIWFVEGDRTLELSEKFKEAFGNDDFIYVLFESEDFFRPENIRRLGALAEVLEEEVPHLLDLTWLGNVEDIEGLEDLIEIEEFLGEVPEDPARLAELRSRALAEPSFVNALISSDGRIAGLLLEMDAYPEGEMDPRKEVPPVVREILARPEFNDLELHAVGGPLIDYDIDVLTAQESALFTAICILVQMAILLWVARGPRGVLVPVVVVVLATTWALGAIALYGFKLNIFIIMLPVLLICVGIGDSMHVIAEFQDQQDRGLARRDALREAMGVVGWPCLLTSVTTAAGFLAFLAARIKPFREMGIYAATGVMIAVVLTYLLVPVLYSWGAERPRSREGRGDAPRDDVFDRLLGWVYRVVVAHPLPIVVFFIGLAAVALVGYSRLEIESNSVEMFSTDVPIRRAYDYVDANMGGSMSMEIMLDTGVTDGITDADFLHAMDELDRFVIDHPLTTKTTSILDVLRKMRRAFHENRPEFYDIPTSREEASQYLLLYESSGGEQKEKLVTFDQDIARLTARTRALDTRDARRFVAELEHFVAQRPELSDRVEITGMLAWVRAMNDLIGQGQKRSFLTAFAVITVIMMLVLRSPGLGLISMLPNIFPVLISLGLMGLAGVYMDMGMMTFAAIIIGVAVDDTIHFFVRYRREFERAGSYEVALRETLASVGRPITFTTLTLTLGFSVLTLSDMRGLVHFGVLAGFAFSWALLADFFFAPAVLLLTRPLGPEREAVKGRAGGD